jgi:signal transduction histidine kinase
MALITPAYINYFTLDESLISYPLIVLSVLMAGHLITKTMGGNSLHSQRNSSVLIYLTGFIPFLANITGQAITHNPATQYPFVITLVTLPLTYYIFMKVLQVLQPRSLEHILDGNFEASDALQEAVTKIVSDEFAHTLSHRWAIYIHGKILTRLAATALKLETATNSGDASSFKKGVDSLVLLLSDPDSEFEQLPTDLETEVHSRLNPWLGLLNVELEIDQDLKVLKNSRVSEFGEVIEELISNSMRHGKSQNISLKVTRVGEKDLHIYAVDDASIAPPESQIRYGLGTRIFNLASDGRWSITRVASSTEFQLTMEIEV